MIPVTLSLGVATGGQGEETDVYALVQAADQALYRAKQNGRRRGRVPGGSVYLRSDGSEPIAKLQRCGQAVRCETAREQEKPMYPFAAFLQKQELWLMRRVRVYAPERDCNRYTSTMEKAWRISIEGLTASITDALAISDEPWELGPDDACASKLIE